MTDINEIKKRNADAGRFFFAKGTLSFFSSRVNPEVYEGPGGVFFVTSERYDSRVLEDFWKPRTPDALGSAAGAAFAMLDPVVSRGRSANRGAPGDRRYTVRQSRESGDVDTFGEFQQYPSLYAAKAAASKLAKEPTQ